MPLNNAVDDITRLSLILPLHVDLLLEVVYIIVFLLWGMSYCIDLRVSPTLLFDFDVFVAMIQP